MIRYYTRNRLYTLEMIVVTFRAPERIAKTYTYIIGGELTVS